LIAWKSNLPATRKMTVMGGQSGEASRTLLGGPEHTVDGFQESIGLARF
jgi:hypothetical protein